ncbi:hypothetical protein Tco_0819892 [Tanacetum coccineum]|uniref:Uncharacterized protein n=1 Tax=Tanacetum coccineum TaxID=301880 RepID=A0ABQ5ABU5_9ASTR
MSMVNSSLKPWYDDFVVKERLVWLEIEGVPLRAWNNDTFNSIGSMWGEFATMMVSLKKVTYAIRVRELCSWTPSFVDGDSCKDEEGSMGSYNISTLACAMASKGLPRMMGILSVASSAARASAIPELLVSCFSLLENPELEEKYSISSGE